MARLGGQERQENTRAANSVVQAGSKLGSLVTQVVAAVTILIIFVGLAYLVLEGRLAQEALILYAGVILGYVLNSIKDLL